MCSLRKERPSCSPDSIFFLYGFELPFPFTVCPTKSNWLSPARAKKGGLNASFLSALSRPFRTSLSFLGVRCYCTDSAIPTRGVHVTTNRLVHRSLSSSCEKSDHGFSLFLFVFAESLAVAFLRQSRGHTTASLRFFRLPYFVS